jgi:hypothetical protein
MIKDADISSFHSANQLDEAAICGPKTPIVHNKARVRNRAQAGNAPASREEYGGNDHMPCLLIACSRGVGAAFCRNLVILQTMVP